MGLKEQLAELEARKAGALQMGGPEAIAKLHERGKLTARERLELLLDKGTFEETGILARSTHEVPGRPTRVIQAGGVVCGYGDINGRRAYVTADDATVASGARGGGGAVKPGRIMHMAVERRAPLIGLMEGSAGQVQKQMGAKQWAPMGYTSGAPAFKDMIEASGVIPTVTAVMGNCVGGAAFHVCLSDFVPMVKGTSFMALSGPPVVERAVGERVTFEDMGGSEVHTRVTGQADYEAKDDRDAIRAMREYLDYMPSSCFEAPPYRQTADRPDRRCERLLEIVPEDLRRPYDMHRVIGEVVDEGRYFPVKANYGREVITCLARLGGHVVGVIASQPTYMAGVVTDQGIYKMIHFTEICDAFHIPVVWLLDVPGVIIGKQWEHRGTLKWVMRMLKTQVECDVPRLTVVMRKAYGFAYMIMGGKAMHPDLFVAWPTASFSLMALEPAVEVIYAREIAASPDPDGARKKYREVYAQQMGPMGAAEDFSLDEVIDPRDTRVVLIKGLEAVLPKRDSQIGFRRHIYP